MKVTCEPGTLDSVNESFTLLIGFINKSSVHVLFESAHDNVCSSDITSTKLPGGLHVVGISSRKSESHACVIKALQVFGGCLFVNDRNQVHALEDGRLDFVPFVVRQTTKLVSHMMTLPINIYCANPFEEASKWFEKSVQLIGNTQHCEEVVIHSALVELNDFRQRFIGPQPIEIKGTSTLIAVTSDTFETCLKIDLLFLQHLQRRISCWTPSTIYKVNVQDNYFLTYDRGTSGTVWQRATNSNWLWTAIAFAIFSIMVMIFLIK